MAPALHRTLRNMQLTEDLMKHRHLADKALLAVAGTALALLLAGCEREGAMEGRTVERETMTAPPATTTDPVPPGATGTAGSRDSQTTVVTPERSQ